MSLGKYAAMSAQFADELLSQNSEEDFSQLREDIVEIGEDGWYDWVNENLKVIRTFIGETPAKQAKRTAAVDQKFKLRLLFAGWHYSRLAARVLSVADDLNPGGGYRDMTSFAAYAGSRIAQRSAWEWPHVDPPFPDWQMSYD